MPKPKTLESESRLPFITGSLVYGSPGKYSDIDLVILVSPSVEQILREHNENHTSIAIRFGGLNIIPVRTEDEYDAWKEATEQMAAVKTKTGAVFTKEAASNEIRLAHKRRGLSYPEFGVSD